MYQHSIAQIKNSIFPVFFQSIQGPTTQIGVSGTGFFIDDQGHFITAHHVTTDVPPNSTLLYLGNVFEVEWLKYISSRYFMHANKDVSRIKMIEDRINNNK